MSAPFDGDDLRRVLGVPLSDEQLAAVTAPAAPAVVVAGAGSGKTTVMTARVVWLVATGQVAPEEVLGLTFTNKAAAELASRVRRALERLGKDGGHSDDVGPTVLTYHAYAARLVREHGVRLGLEPGAELVPEAVRYQLAERVVRSAPGPFSALRGTVSDLSGRVVALDSELNEHLVQPGRVAEFDLQTVADIDAAEAAAGALTARPRGAREVARARTDLLALVAAYRAEKLRRDVVDFGDQMAAAARLAESVPEVVAGERVRFRAVLLDEYQDTSITQKRLLLALFGDGHPVTAVGDPFQAIYGWRGASVRNIGSFAAEFGVGDTPANAFTLARNNRSGGRILELANLVAEPLRDRHPEVPVLVARPDAEGGGEVAAGLFLTRSDEVAAVVDDITRQLAGGTPAREIAVLARAASTFPAFAEALTAADIPVEVVGLGGLLALPEVVDLVSVLEVLDDATANPAMVRLLVGPRWRIGVRDLALLGRRAQDLVREAPTGAVTDPPSGSTVRSEPEPGEVDRLEAALLDAVAGVDPAEMVSLSDAVAMPGLLPYSAQARERFALLAGELADLRRHRSDPLLELVHRVLAVTGLDVEVSASPHARRARRRENLDAFLGHVADFAQLDSGAGITSFLAYLRAAGTYQRGLDNTAPSSSDSVKLLTVHKAKGLEWEVVYLPDLVAKVFPSTTPRSLWTGQPQVLPYPLRGDAVDFPGVTDWRGNQPLERFAAQMRDLDAAEERRLGYVAFTRAKRRCVATAHWWGPTQRSKRGPGDFCSEALAFCGAGGGDVIHLEPEPEETANPALADPAAHSWPAEGDPAAAEARHHGADLVRARLSGGSPRQSVLPPEWQEAVTGWDDDLEALLAEAREAHTVDRAVPLPVALSASQLVRLSSDPAGLARELARPMPRPPAPAAARGTRFHAWVEARFGQAALLDLDELGGAADDERFDVDLERLQAAFVAGPYADRPPLAVEAAFQLVVGSHTVRGRIDAVYARDDGFEVVDWKTGRSPADPLQLAVYRLAWAELMGVEPEQVSAAFYYVVSGQVVRPEALPGRDALVALLSA